MTDLVKKADELDPELPDVTIQSISILFNVATLLQDGAFFDRVALASQTRAASKTRTTLEYSFVRLEEALRILLRP